MTAAVRPAAFRPAAPSDAAALAGVAAITFPLACPPHTTDEAKRDFISRNLGVDSFERYLADPARSLFVAELDDVAEPGRVTVGYAMVVHGEPSDPDVQAAVTVRPTSELSKLYVHPDHHGAGVAGLLMASSIESARAAGAASIWLGVNQENGPPNAFYAKQGFERVGTKHFLVGDRWEDDFVRLLPLSTGTTPTADS